MNDILMGFANVFHPVVLFWVSFGTILGVIIAALPGLSGTMGMAILIPLSYVLGPTPAIAMLAAMYCAANYGGSITAILVNAPGTPAATATAFDGYPLAKMGKAGKALGMATIASATGGLFSVLCLIILAPQLAKIARQFGAPEYFTLTIFALSMITRVGGKSPLKNMAAMMIGLLLATVGTDPINGFPRFTFGNGELAGGIDYIPVMIGLFAAAEVFMQAIKADKKVKVSAKIAGLLPTFKEIMESKITIIRASILGLIIGILPGEGGTMAAFLSYSDAKRRSKNPDKFGKGALEGVAAAETANNAATGGAMVPTLALGIPGSSGTAVILGALMIHGLKPGPLLFIQQKSLVYTVFAGMILANIIFLIVGLVGAKGFAQVTRIPARILNPIIMVLCVVGSYALSRNPADVLIMLASGLIGYQMKKNGFSAATLVIGLILGGMLETNLRRMIMMFNDNLTTLIFGRPWALLFVVLTILQITQFFYRRIREKHEKISA